MHSYLFKVLLSVCKEITWSIYDEELEQVNIYKYYKFPGNWNDNISHRK